MRLVRRDPLRHQPAAGKIRRILRWLANFVVLCQNDVICEFHSPKTMELILVVVISAGMAGNSQNGVSRSLTICQHIPVVRKNHKNQLTQQFDIICCLARGLALCIESKQIMSLLSCESATLKRGPQLCGQRCGRYLRH